MMRFKSQNFHLFKIKFKVEIDILIISVLISFFICIALCCFRVENEMKMALNIKRLVQITNPSYERMTVIVMLS